MKHKQTIALCLIFGGASTISGQNVDGYPVANFAITANASAQGGLYGRIMQNPGKLGKWLAERGSIIVGIDKDGKYHALSDFKQKNISRMFPFVKSSYTGSALTAAAIEVKTFCPLAVNDAQTSSLPVIMLEMVCKNPMTILTEFNIVLTPDSMAAAHASMSEIAVQTTAHDGIQFMDRNKGMLKIPVSIEPRGTQRIRIALAYYDRDWVSARQFASAQEAARYALGAWSMLHSKTAQFEAAIPRSGDAQIDAYLRWYMTAGISLTKITKNTDVLTMGYCELNQRDSYWTSWLHLALFKDLERKMIEESAAAQQPSGKIPTTILPLIERHDDLDINAFFILRAARYYEYYHDRDALKNLWASVKNAMDWLLARDCNGSGLPCQVSFWGDWKDVRGVEGRRYSPFSGFVYLAALKKMSELAGELEDYPAKQKYDAAYQKGYAFINRNTDDGGLWNGSYYCQRWADGSVNERLLQDQTVGIFFGVTPQERAAKVFDALNAKSTTPYGIAETSPYYDKEWGYPPAVYHNGAVWPWLNFMDCWARLRSGRRDEAIMLIKKVAAADLVNSGDWSPNEHINSRTGENLGFILQGWNAALFGVVGEMQDYNAR
jgi:uncharacterized protein (DUF608 family)